MKKYIMLLPLPMGGLVLSLVSLATLLVDKSYFFIANILIGISSILWLALLMKCLFLIKDYKELQHPIIASVFPTISMASMVFCGQINRLSEQMYENILGRVWLIFCLLHYAWLFYFSYRFVIKNKARIQHVYPSWFIVYVGVGIVTSTGINFYPTIAKISLGVALFMYAWLLPLILYRIFGHKQFNESEWPLVTILAAPGSLCLVGYLKIMPTPHVLFATGLFILSQVLYVTVLFLISYKRVGKFYPSFSAYTFPLVISATASYVYTEKCLSLSTVYSLMQWLSRIELVIAIGMVGVVFSYYMMYLSKQIKLMKKSHEYVN